MKWLGLMMIILIAFSFATFNMFKVHDSNYLAAVVADGGLRTRCEREDSRPR